MVSLAELAVASPDAPLCGGAGAPTNFKPCRDTIRRSFASWLGHARFDSFVSANWHFDRSVGSASN